MNNSLFLWLVLFLPAMAFGQNKEIVTDSSWIVNRNGIFYQLRAQVFSNGEESTTAVPLGDTIQTVQKFRDNIRNTVATFASDAQITSGYRLQVTEILRYGRSLPPILGKSPIDSLRNDQKNLLDQGWAIHSGGSSTGLRFRVTAGGVFQWKADTTSTWRAAAFLGGVIRLNTFQGYTEDFWRTPKGRWVSANQRYTIRPPGDIAARDIADIPEDNPAPADPAPPKTELLAGGIVRIGEVLYKFNSRSKKWEQL